MRHPSEPEWADPKPTTCMTCYALVSPGYESEHAEWHSDLWNAVHDG